MLGIMRKYKQSMIIKGVFAVIVLSFIGTIFLIWGKGDEGKVTPITPLKSAAPSSPTMSIRKLTATCALHINRFTGKTSPPSLKK